jgi:hypothetical protein
MSSQISTLAVGNRRYGLYYFNNQFVFYNSNWMLFLWTSGTHVYHDYFKLGSVFSTFVNHVNPCLSIAPDGRLVGFCTAQETSDSNPVILSYSSNVNNIIYQSPVLRDDLTCGGATTEAAYAVKYLGQVGTAQLCVAAVDKNRVLYRKWDHSWTQAATRNFDLDDPQYGIRYVNIARDHSGRVFVMYYDYDIDDDQQFVAIGTADGGETWTEEFRINIRTLFPADVLPENTEFNNDIKPIVNAAYVGRGGNARWIFGYTLRVYYYNPYQSTRICLYFSEKDADPSLLYFGLNYNSYGSSTIDVGATENGEVYLATHRYIWRSHDGGVTWGEPPYGYPIDLGDLPPYGSVWGIKTEMSTPDGN